MEVRGGELSIIIQFIPTQRACISIGYTSKNGNAIRPWRVSSLQLFHSLRDGTRRLSGNDRVHTRYIIISIVAFATVRALPSPPGFHWRGFSKSSSRAVAPVKIRQALSKRPCSLPNREPLLPPPPFLSFESCSIFFSFFFFIFPPLSLSSTNPDSI